MKNRTPFIHAIATKTARKLRARRTVAGGIWLGLGMMGLVGWSVAVPTLLGTALGVWIDNSHPGRYSWTLMLLLAGLCLGCLNAWRWIDKEDKKMREEEEKNDG